MNPKTAVQQENSKLDVVKWLFVFLLFAGGIVANYYYSNVAWAIRAAVGIVVLVFILLIASQTIKGRKALDVIKGARTELRKVVWPTRQETVQTTLVVVAMVVVTALILWGIDSLFLWFIGWLTGQRG